ncbi:tail assembly chaperone [Gordonia phage Gibbles]|nr:tail assembly chaperone [Gordonia phage Gibbles]
MTNPYPTDTADPTSLNYNKTPEQIAAEQAAAANGVPTTTVIRKDYWANDVDEKWYLPGQDDIPEHERQYISFKKMNEGMRSKYQKMTNKGVVIERASNNARMGVDPAGDRRALIEVSLTGWKLFRDGNELNFNTATLNLFLTKADPYLIDQLEKAIRKVNKWMFAEATSAEIQEQIDELEEQKQAALDREEEEKKFVIQVRSYVRNEPVENPHPALRAFMITELLKMQLPVDGGWYNMDPILLDKWLIIFEERGKAQKEEERKREKKQKMQNPARPTRRRGR